MIRVGLISNPRSQRNKRQMPALRAAAAAQPELLHVEIDSVHTIHEVLHEFARRDVGLIVVSGGDGTIQKVVTDMLNSGEVVPSTPLALLPSGMTNLIAADVGMSGDPARSLARLCRHVAANDLDGERLVRSVLSLWRTPTEAPIHGLFLGTAAFYHGIMLARRRVHSLGVKHQLAAAMAIGLGLLRLLFGKKGTDDLRRGERMTVAVDQRNGLPHDYLLFLATTLERLFLGVMPFWGDGAGHLRYTSIAYPPEHLWRAVLPVVRGRPQSWMSDHGYRSGRAVECKLRLSCPIVFDGELVTPEPDMPVVLRGDRQVTFWRC